MNDSRKKTTYIANKRSVEKALGMFKTKKQSKRISNEEQRQNEVYRKITNYCKSSINNSGRNRPREICFSRLNTLREMRLLVAQHEWSTLQRYFPLLLEMSIEREPIIWRYMMIILLHSPRSSISNLRDFLEICLNIRDEDEHPFLRKLLTLRSKSVI